MGTYGGFAPMPERYGGGKTRLEYVLDVLVNIDEGQVGLDASGPPHAPLGTAPWVEDMSLARALNAAWETNQRSAFEFDPRRTTGMLQRWEAIFGLSPDASDGGSFRRSRLTFKFEAFGKDPTGQQFDDDLRYLAGTAYVQILTVSSTTGPAYYPGSPFVNPYTIDGLTVAGESLVDWWSGVLHLGVQVQQPAGMSGGQFQRVVGDIVDYLDGALPAWVTFDVFQLNPRGSQGFFLDEANLGLECFRI